MILPESLDNLPMPKSVGGADLCGIFPAASDVVAGVGSAANIRYMVDQITYANFLLYKAGGASAVAGLAADPTESTGTAYTTPFAIASNVDGVLVRAVAIIPGRSLSTVSAAYYWPVFPDSIAAGGG